MADRNVVLDTSAVMAFLCDEEGADTVEGCLNKARKGGIQLYMSFATLAEVFSSATKKEGKDRAEFYVAVIKSWPARWVHSSEELCLSAGMLKAQYRISFADAFIAATAIHFDAFLVHKDPEFEALKAILRTESLPYKHRG
ncbi:MAG: PIN domain-containing protein [Kiritimatiellia bacterium]|nr:PIN domain-containing protein [Kiritimatiellia bacterium]